MSASEAGRFSLFTEKEKATISIAFVTLILDAAFGVITGEPAPPERLADILETVTPMVNEIGADFGQAGINPDLLGEALAKLRASSEEGS